MPALHDITWQLHPLLLGSALVALLAYFHLEKRWGPANLRQRFSWVSAFVVITLATASPWDALGRNGLFVVRMGESLLIAYVLSAFILSAIPDTWLKRIEDSPRTHLCLKQMVHVFWPGVLFNGYFLLWHLPVFYQMGLENLLWHQIHMGLLLPMGMIMWLPIINPLPRTHLSDPEQMFYVVTLIFGSIPIFALLSFSGSALYPSYDVAPRLVGLSAYADQQLGGWMHKMLSALIFSGSFALIFLRWNRRQRQEDSQENQAHRENFALAQRANPRHE